MTELTPYRIDGRKVIAEFEAPKPDMPGTAARVLDYSAIWIHADGSARMLEHEILCIQSREGIQEQAEQRPARARSSRSAPSSATARVLEPEIVPGKETVTMPHLEIGDYIETETITTLRGDGQGGQRFEGPRWFFREAKIPYFRSEFITISPKNRPLDIETGGSVPRPDVTESGALVIRRWRVDKSPALPEEPASAPSRSSCPTCASAGASTSRTPSRAWSTPPPTRRPRDPRLLRVAQAIVRRRGSAASHAPPAATGEAAATGEPASPGPPATAATAKPRGPAGHRRDARRSSRRGRDAGVSIEEKARRIYRWVLANVEAGRETDGRRVVMGKSGDRDARPSSTCAGSRASTREVGLVRDRLARAAHRAHERGRDLRRRRGAPHHRDGLALDGGPRQVRALRLHAELAARPARHRAHPGAPRETTPTVRLRRTA